MDALRRGFYLFGLVAGVAFPSVLFAQDYPVKPVRIVTGSPGNFNDIVARRLAHALAERLGQPFVVENRSGAGLTIGTHQAARSAPDGYTLVLSDRTALSVAPSLHKNLSYDPVKDLAPIALVAATPLILIAHSSVPAASFSDLIQYLKREQAVNFLTSGGATGNHLANEQFRQAAQVNVLSVHYKGSPAAMMGLIAGEVRGGFMLVPLALPHIRSGRVKAYAITSAKRFAGAPDIPTVTELGMADLESDYWLAMMAPAGTSNVIVDRLTREIADILATAAVRELLLAQGAEATYAPPSQLAAFIVSETTKWKKVIETAGVRID